MKCGILKCYKANKRYFTMFQAFVAPLLSTLLIRNNSFHCETSNLEGIFLSFKNG